MKPLNIAVVVGSIRQESYNRQFAEALVRLFPAEVKAHFVRIDDLPLYSQDSDAQPPVAPVARLRQDIAAADGVLFVTPEYNRSVPAVLKNALDVGSRPYGRSVWAGKPGAVISVSTGAIGGFGAHHHLRQILVSLNVPTMPQPEAYIGGAENLFDSRGRPVDEATRRFLVTFMEAFAVWVGKHTRPRTA